MRIFAIIALAAMTFGFASCAKDKPATTTTTEDHRVTHGYKK